MQRGLPQKRSIKDVKKVIAVSSAKGGVGKSTIAGTILKMHAAVEYDLLTGGQRTWHCVSPRKDYDLAFWTQISSDRQYRRC